MLLVSVALLLPNCKPPQEPVLKTKKLILRADSAFNDGYRLPVDLVFIREGEAPDTVTGIGPDDWFDSDDRDKWAFKQSLSLIHGERKTVVIHLKRPSNAVAMVIVADYKPLKDAKGQVVVLAADAAEVENVFITIDGLLH